MMCSLNAARSQERKRVTEREKPAIPRQRSNIILKHRIAETSRHTNHLGPLLIMRFLAVILAVNLVAGRYLISLWATGPNHYGRGENCYDVVEHCIELDLEPSNFYGSGKGANHAFGIVLFPCTWKLPSQRGDDEPSEAFARARSD